MEVNKTSRKLGSIIGIIIIALGVAIIVKANIGIDPWGVFFNAVQLVYMQFKPDFFPNMRFGDSITIVSFVIVMSASFLLKEKIKWLSIIGGVLLGQFVNVWSFILSGLTPFKFDIMLLGLHIDLVSILMLLIGIVILSLGVGLTIHCPFIMTPVDYLMYALDIKIKKVPYGIIRVISDICMTLIGTMIILFLTQDMSQTRVGIGTILMFLITGLVIDIFQRKMKKYFETV